MTKKKNQLASGSFRVQLLDYVDSAGKKHYKSFTAPTRAEAKKKAAAWRAKKEEYAEDDILVTEAIRRYIEMKRQVLSPSTIRSYEGIKRNYFKNRLGRAHINDVDSQMVQLWISNLSTAVSPKTVRNAYGVLRSSLEMFRPEIKLHVQLPAPLKPDLYVPNDNDIQRLLDYAAEDKNLEMVILLAAFGPMRRGEICALTSDDICGNYVTVSKSMVEGPDGWVIKQPKTYSSYRVIEMPEFVIRKMSGIKGRIVKVNPSQVTGRFGRAVKKSGVPHFRLHDLRHYSASIMHAIGIPDQYIMQRGGWATDAVMKTVYRNVIDIEEIKQNKIINDKFAQFNIG